MAARTKLRAKLDSPYIDLTSFNHFIQNLDALRQLYGPAFMKVRPQFGAYMEYSAVLEYGRKDRRMMEFHIPGGFLVSSTGAPHIRPAVYSNIPAITKHLRDVGQQACRETLYAQAAGKPPLSLAKMIARVEKAWGQVLNDKPRRDAVKNAPYEFGFHRRSIQGDAYPPNPSKIEALRAQARHSREKKRWKDKAKSLAKKRGGKVLTPVDL